MSRRKHHPFRHASRRPPASGRKPASKLPVHTVVASAEALLAFHRHFEACFRRREQRQWSLFRNVSMGSGHRFRETSVERGCHSSHSRRVPAG
jgi:hypothetical protein